MSQDTWEAVEFDMQSVPATVHWVRVWNGGKSTWRVEDVDALPVPEVNERNWSDSGSFANIQWPQFTFTPKPEPSPDAKPAIAGLMRVTGEARGLGWCDE